MTVSEILGRLESHYGPQLPDWPTDPYLFLVWWHCGYPASDAACAKGWASLSAAVGTTPQDILAASHAALTDALRQGGLYPEKRSVRLKEIAERIERDLGGDLARHLHAPIPQLRRLLKRFPGISDPGVDRILLFAGIAPLPAVPSNCPHVLVRITRGDEREDYTVNYRQAAESIAAAVPENVEARKRAYLLLKQHGQQLCKRSNPKCDACPLNSDCRFFGGQHRGRGART